MSIEVFNLILPILGVIVGFATTFGVLRSTVNDLRAQVDKLMEATNEVYTLKASHANAMAVIGVHSIQIEEVRAQIHAIEVKMARAGIGD